MIITAIYSFWLYNRIFFVNEIIQAVKEELYIHGVIENKVKGKRPVYISRESVGVPVKVKKEKLIYGDVDIYEFGSISLMVVLMLIVGMKPSIIEMFIDVNSLELISKK